MAKPARIALGALIIKEKCGFSDRETVEQITENPYGRPKVDSSVISIRYMAPFQLLPNQYHLTTATPMADLFDFLGYTYRPRWV